MTSELIRHVEASGSIGTTRGAVIVCVPVYGQHDLAERCIASVLAHTAPDVPILIADDASPDDGTTRYVEAVADGRVWYLRQPENVGFVANCNIAFGVAAPADVVILNSDCEVGPGWLEGLRQAAYSDSLVATATALTNHGTIVSVGRGGATTLLPGSLSPAELAQRVADASLRLRPRILTAVGHCMWIRRSALDLVGDFDEAFSPGYGEEVDFSQRCLLRGLSHVAADDVFVFHRGGSSFDNSPLQREHERLLARRYPYYPGAVRAVDRRTAGPLRRSIGVARTAMEGMSVTIDARVLGRTVTGTQIHVLELILALHRSGRVQHLRAVVPAGIGPVFLDPLRRLDGVELLIADELADGREITPSAIVHRPYQVFDSLELELLARLGDRLIVTHQDLISYRNPGYSRSFEDWDAFHRLTRLTLSLADEVLFFSHHAAADALSEELVGVDRAHVAHLGVDHRATTDEPVPSRPARAPEGSFILCIGTNFRHKNRLFALDVLESLRNAGWSGTLVFAGPHAAAGTSEDEEKAWLAAHAEHASFVVDLAEVSEAEKVWLLRSADGVLYPSVYEGFGLVPFEAAASGTPCFFAWHTALCETLPEAAATIVPWDAEATARRIMPLITDRDAASAQIELITAAAHRLTWDETAAKVLDVYDLAVRAPDRTIVRIADDVGSPAGVGARLSGRSVSALDLPEDVYRAFRALASRPPLRAPLYGMLRTTYRVGHLLRHRRTPEKIV
jgi:GT2 family glycosyltransferase/glycosyltransferase involved in cell wall biosynthesis